MRIAIRPVKWKVVLNTNGNLTFWRNLYNTNKSFYYIEDIDIKYIKLNVYKTMPIYVKIYSDELILVFFQNVLTCDVLLSFHSRK